MPKIRFDKADTVERVTLRLDKDTALYYRKRAKEKGTTLSEFLRQAVMQGMIAESALDIEFRMKMMLDEINHYKENSVNLTIPENIVMSMYTCESILSKIVEQRNIQELYDAQDSAKERIKREKRASHV